MGEAKHTPVPWGLGQPQSQVWGDKNRTLICEVYTSEDDARLIAAAPELLEALHSIIYRIRNGEMYLDGKGQIGKETWREIELAEAAIRKAKGE
jgi:hypothetical protein